MTTDNEPIRSPLKAIRAKCLDCSCNSTREARLCVILDCPLYPFRMGKNPYRMVSEARREHGRRLAALRIKSVKGKNEILAE
jgi:hypothetical protein